MSYIPDHLTLKNGIAQADFIQSSNNDLLITTAGVLKIAGGSGVEASVLLSVAGTDPDDNPIKYSFPDVNIGMPEQDQIISFNSDGTSQFINNGGGSAGSLVNTNYLIDANVGDTFIFNGTNGTDGTSTNLINVNTTNNNISLNVGDSGGSLSRVNIGTTNCFLQNDTDELIVRSEVSNVSIQSKINDITLVAALGVVKVRSDNGLIIRNNTTTDETTLQQQGDGNFSITNPVNFGNIDFNLPNGYGKVRFNKSANFSSYVDFQGDTTHYANIAVQNNGRQIFIDNTTNTYGELKQDTAGVFNITNDNGILVNTSAGLSFNGIGNLNSSGSNLVLNNGDGNLQLSSKFNDVIVSTEGGGKFQVNEGSLFLGDMTINKVDPQLNFNNTDYPTQQCNIAFESATQELIIEHHSPDDAAKCNIRLGKNDIDIETTFVFSPGNINLKPNSGFVNINGYSLPNTNPTVDGQLLSANIDGTSSWITPTLPPGLLRAINCNLNTPTEIVDVVWSNLTPTEQLAWKGGDPTTTDPIQSATDNYWNFTKASVSAAKIGWFIPDDFSALSFQDLTSFWVVIRFNTTTNISTEGSLYLSLQTSPPTGLNTFRTRWNYSNTATPMNQTGYFYKLYALDTITTTTTANFGKGQEIGQTQFKNNPVNVSPELWSIGLNKQVLSPTGDTTAGYTIAPLQNISLQTASNINTFNFDVVSIGYLNKQYNLHFA